MPQTQDSDENVAPLGDFAPRAADTHLSVIIRTAPVVPERSTIWPLAPWRMTLIAVAIFIAIPCGIAAAQPPINGAELGCLISLAMFVAAFTPGKD
ncbi:hypothetical protein [Microbacterium sp. K24]|uniref:hypothetical protein n=1 Tax=Microbacterium sp. K24 TaxID=2305446 RepID=UPI00109BF633|nr:hypothetical protein [Microbacterium sp. K24]